MWNCSKSKTDMYAAFLYLRCQEACRACWCLNASISVKDWSLEWHYKGRSFHAARHITINQDCSTIGFICCRRAERMQQLSHVSCSTLDPFTLGRSANSYLITSTWGMYTSRRFQACGYERLMQAAWWGTYLFLCDINLKKTCQNHILHCDFNDS